MHLLHSPVLTSAQWRKDIRYSRLSRGHEPILRWSKYRPGGSASPDLVGLVPHGSGRSASSAGSTHVRQTIRFCPDIWRESSMTSARPVENLDLVEGLAWLVEEQHEPQAIGQIGVAGEIYLWMGHG
jgi:hypothetical protein